MIEFFAFGLLDEARISSFLLTPGGREVPFSAHPSGTCIALGLLSSIALSSMQVCSVYYLVRSRRNSFRIGSNYYIYGTNRTSLFDLAYF